MRLLKYFSYSNLDEKTNQFRCFNIRLVKEQEDLNEIIEHIKNKYSIDEDLYLFINKLNSEIKGHYKGQYKFNFTLTEGVPLSKINLPVKIEIKIKSMLYEFNDKLAKIKRRIEKV